jgi:hypothetical protein
MVQRGCSDRRCRRVRRHVVGCAAVALALATAGTASAAVGPQGIRDGKNITVFHNIDFVAAFGHSGGDDVRVDVLRGGHHLATARGPAADIGPPEIGGVEVNHGVEPGATAGPGDCWEGATPDIRPGDLIRVTSTGGVDEVIVDDLNIETMTRVAGPDGVADNNDDEVWVEGVAKSGLDGSPLPTPMLDSGEFRDPLDGQFRLEPNAVEAHPTVPGRYIAKYFAPFNFVKLGKSTEATLVALQRDGHAFGYGHAPLPNNTLRPDAMLVEGAGATHGPALGCGDSPAYASTAGTVSVEALNAAHLDALADGDVALTVGGWTTGPGAAVVELRDGVGTSVSRSVTGEGWSASFTKGELAGLQQGALTARLLIDGTPVGATKTVTYDTVAPSFSVTPDAGTYTGAQRVIVSGDPVTYQLDGEPSRPYSGLGIDLGTGRHTLVLRSEDAAGNVTSRTLEYDIRAPLVTLAAPAPQPIIRVAGVTATPPLSASGLRMATRVTAAKARRAGLKATFTAPSAGRSAIIRIYRMTGGKRHLVGLKRTALRPGRNTVQLNAGVLRRKLKPALYQVEVTVRDANGTAGRAISANVRILR